MYLLSKMSKNAQSFITEIMGTGFNRSNLFLLGAGYALTSFIAIPASCVEDKESYYRLNVEVAVERMISQLNELMPLDIEKIKLYAKQFYFQRMDAAYPSKLPLAFKDGSGVYSVFSISKNFDVGSLEEINTNPTRFTQAVFGVNSILEVIRERLAEDYAILKREETVYVA